MTPKIHAERIRIPPLANPNDRQPLAVPPLPLPSPPLPRRVMVADGYRNEFPIFYRRIYIYIYIYIYISLSLSLSLSHGESTFAV
jgi:hypothetical protein